MRGAMTFAGAVWAVSAVAGPCELARGQPIGPVYTLPQVPPALTFLCQYMSGPLAGQTIYYGNYPGAIAFPVGAGCQDGQGSFGYGVPQAGPAFPSPSPPPNDAIGGGAPPPARIEGTSPWDIGGPRSRYP